MPGQPLTVADDSTQCAPHSRTSFTPCGRGGKSDTDTSPPLSPSSVSDTIPLYSPFGDGEGRGYTVHLLFDICQSHHQESAARMPQIFDHRSMSVSHTTRNLRHVCRNIIPQSVNCSSSSWNFNEICSTDAADFLSACMSKINFWQTCLRLQKLFIYQC
jgi:hypothetical protein